MRPLTDSVPKPLLPVAGKPLIEHLIAALRRAGLTEIAINHSYLGNLIEHQLGDGDRLGVHLNYSREAEGALETGGGIYQALPLLRSDPFVVLNGDIWTDYPFARLPRQLDGLAHLVLVTNPAHHPTGDFCLDDGGVRDDCQQRLTFSGIGVYRHALFARCSPGKFPLAPVLRAAMKSGTVKGEQYHGRWYDVGTPERLKLLESELLSSSR